MIGKSTLKVPGGKLLKAEVNYEGELIRSAKVCGDFFMHPEDAIEKLDKKLRNIDVKDLEKAVSEALEGAQIYGAGKDSITKVILEAMK